MQVHCFDAELFCGRCWCSCVFSQQPDIASFVMSPNSDTNALAGALGSIIGYLGAEGSEPSLFDRLLWPQRFYNDNSVFGAIKAALLMPMGGPIHKAALERLDGFRKNGLYGGMQHGHMLGTSFFANTELTYKIHGYKGSDHDDEVRNGLWVSVMQKLRGCKLATCKTPAEVHDTEKLGQEPATIRRASQYVQHLILSSPESISTSNVTKVREYSEGNITAGALATIVASELTALTCAFVILWVERCLWFAAYLCLPLALKLLAVPCSVRREPMGSPHSSQSPKLNTEPILVEISDYNHGFPLIEGPEAIVRQFFRNWGHPVRRTHMDRARELTSMTLVIAFVLCFPIGLLSMLWVSLNVQIVWLSFQVYTIVAMHLNRLIGLHGPGRMEDSMAQTLADGKIVRLRSNDGSTIEARLESHAVASITHGREGPGNCAQAC
jgi:hypothetical protein